MKTRVVQCPTCLTNLTVGEQIGHYIDTEVQVACPQCGQLLKIAGFFTAI